MSLLIYSISTDAVEIHQWHNIIESYASLWDWHSIFDVLKENKVYGKTLVRYFRFTYSHNIAWSLLLSSITDRYIHDQLLQTIVLSFDGLAPDTIRATCPNIFISVEGPIRTSLTSPSYKWHIPLWRNSIIHRAI